LSLVVVETLVEQVVQVLVEALVLVALERENVHLTLIQIHH
jgi:hypothetical protein